MSHIFHSLFSKSANRANGVNAARGAFAVLLSLGLLGAAQAQTKFAPSKPADGADC
jgi:hypothetical protein